VKTCCSTTSRYSSWNLCLKACRNLARSTWKKKSMLEKLSQTEEIHQNSIPRVINTNRHQLQFFYMQKWKVHLNKTIAVPGSPTWDPSAFSSKYWKSVEKVCFVTPANATLRQVLSPLQYARLHATNLCGCTPTIDVLTNGSKLYLGVKVSMV
jgi:hypothetical protein